MSNPTQPDHVELYQRVDDLWEWRRKAANGQVVATSGSQGYTTRSDAHEAAVRENPGMIINLVEENSGT